MVLKADKFIGADTRRFGFTAYCADGRIIRFEDGTYDPEDSSDVRELSALAYALNGMPKGLHGIVRRVSGPGMIVREMDVVTEREIGAL